MSDGDRGAFVRRAALRFAVIYLGLFIAPAALSALPWVGDSLGGGWTRLWQIPIEWVGTNVLHLSIADGPDNGSTDQGVDWIRTALSLVLAAVGAGAGAVMGRRSDATREAEWLRAALRYFLGMVMWQYGFDKVWNSQFPPPSPEQLIRPVGQLSPMGLLWTFMGSSQPYTIFGGAAEVVGGTLLFFRRTTTLGALICAGVLTNVVMLNLCYDVPVKINSSHFLAIALALAAPDTKRLFDALVLGRSFEPAPIEPHSLLGHARVGAAAKALAMAVILFSTLSRARAGWLRVHGPRAGLFGVWEVESFTQAGAELSSSDPKRWSRLVVGNSTRAVISSGNEPDERWHYEEDDANHLLKLHRHGEECDLTFTRPDDAQLVLDGELRGQRVAARLRHHPEFLLTARGFHWVNEAPFFGP